jgi:hypothetical protein
LYDLAPSKRTRDDGSRGGLQRRREIFLLLDKDQIAGLCGAKARDTADLRVPVADQDGVHKLRHFFHSTFHASCIAAGFGERKLGDVFGVLSYNRNMQRKMFWLIVVVLEVAAFWLPFWWQFFAIVPIAFIAWWVAYRSEWFE